MNGSDPDFAWHPNVLVNEDRLCHVVRTPTRTARTTEIRRIAGIARETRTVFRDLDCDDCFHNYLQVLEEHDTSGEYEE